MTKEQETQNLIKLLEQLKLPQTFHLLNVLLDEYLFSKRENKHNYNIQNEISFMRREARNFQFVLKDLIDKSASWEKEE